MKSNNISAEVIADAFSSEEFCQGFCEFLHTLDGIIEFDNNKKIDKFIKFLENVIKKNTFKVILLFFPQPLTPPLGYQEIQENPMVKNMDRKYQKSGL